MSSPWRNPREAVPLALLAIADVGGFTLIGFDHQLAGWIVVVVALGCQVAVSANHDRVHRRRGEAAHAMTGRSDRRNRSPKRIVLGGLTSGLLYGGLTFARSHLLVGSIVEGALFGAAMSAFGVYRARHPEE
jgi:hypothetical protein